MLNSSSMLSAYEASTPKLYPSWVGPKYRVGLVVTSLLLVSGSRLNVFFEATQHVSCFVWFQHPLAADNLGVGVVLTHLSVDSLVSDAVEFCGFGDYVLFALSSARSTSNSAFVSVSAALISKSASTRDFFITLSRVSGSPISPDES